MKDNKGFSLLELLVVIAFIAVMGTFVFVGMGLLTGQYARECANDISAALSKEKSYSMTRSATVDCYMELLYKESDGYYVRYYQPASAVATGKDTSGVLKGDDWVLAEEEKVGKSSVSVTCTLNANGSTQDVTIDDSNSVKFVYDRTNGALKEVIQSDGATLGIKEGADKAICKSITIKRGKTYEITMHSATGKHELTRTD